jgi:branched-chain amino acid transport system ATP-binding protein
MLTLEAVHAHYGSAHVLHGVSLTVAAGQIACLLGRNGVGKSTTLKTIMGVVRPSGGTIAFKGERIDGRSPHAIAARGLAWVPEDRRVFPSLSVAENVRVAGQATPRSSPAHIAEALAFFPDLMTRARQRAGSLSGGQQQMLAMARALAGRPDLILLDEPTEGLSPLIVETIRRGILEARSRGTAILLVEQNFSLALGVADAFFVLSRGAVVYSGTREELRARPDVVREHLGVGKAGPPVPRA